MTPTPADPDKSKPKPGPTEILPSGDLSGINTETTAFDTSSISNSAPAAKSESRTDILPKQFGRYRIVKLLGQGGMGSVYLAQDTQLDRPVALKIPRIEADATGKLEARFQREARAVAQLNHPHICPVFDVGEIMGKPFLAMAFIKGQSLTAFLETGQPQPERGIALTIYKIALALEEAHSKGILHRDLKPANVMVDSRGEPIVMDFGLSHRFNDEAQSRLTQEGTVIGTPAYMAPEQIDGRAPIGPATDVYSLGVVMYELLTGKCPYQGSMISVIGQVLHNDPPAVSAARPNISPALASVCEKAMAKEAAERFPTMKEFAAAIAAFMKGKTTVVATQLAVTQPMAARPAATPASRPQSAAPQQAASPKQPASAAGANASTDPTWDELLVSNESALLEEIASSPMLILPGQAPKQWNKLLKIGLPIGIGIIILIGLLLYAFRPRVEQTPPAPNPKPTSPANQTPPTGKDKSASTAAEHPPVASVPAPSNSSAIASPASNSSASNSPGVSSPSATSAAATSSDHDPLFSDPAPKPAAELNSPAVTSAADLTADPTVVVAADRPGETAAAAAQIEPAAAQPEANAPAASLSELPVGTSEVPAQKDLPALFTKWDLNHDGQLDPEELELHIIHRADKNSDRQLSLDEFEKGYARLKEKLFSPPTAAERKRLPR